MKCHVVRTLVYQIEVQDRVKVQGEISLHVYIVKLIKLLDGISFLFHENQRAGGYFSSKLISMSVRLFGTLE